MYRTGIYILLLMVPLLCNSARAQETSITIGTKVTVCGTLTYEHHFGPPNFGESPKTDTRFVASILRTKKSILAVVPHDSKWNATTNRIQLYFSNGNTSKAWVGQDVCVTGISADATAPSDVAPVNISVDRIQPWQPHANTKAK